MAYKAVEIEDEEFDEDQIESTNIDENETSKNS